MYGALQGKNKSETAAKYGEDQVKVSFDDKKKRILHFAL
jgi:bisphosphoglycerate-dependent phosphoglycerate mutase